MKKIVLTSMTFLLFSIIRSFGGTVGKQPGAGGGSGFSMLSGALVLNGLSGGHGLVTIRF